MGETFFSGIKKGQKEFGEDIGTLVNTILLTIVYIVGVGPTSIIAKIVKKRFLNLKRDKSAKTYWEDLNLNKRQIEEYYRQF